MGADDDYSCDLCGTVRKQRDMTLCSSELLQDAVRAGLRPEQSVSAGLVSKEEFEADWVAKALADDTGWGLCQDCAARVQGYLEDDGAWSVRGPSPGA
ncbi:MAG: hypothetical protein ACXVRV_10725 [Gaiellaceae bacterium]